MWVVIVITVIDLCSNFPVRSLCALGRDPMEFNRSLCKEGRRAEEEEVSSFWYSGFPSSSARPLVRVIWFFSLGIMGFLVWIVLYFGVKKEMIMHAQWLQSCSTLSIPMDCSPPGSSVHEIPQARIIEWVTIPSSRRSSQSRNRTHVCLHLLHCRWILYPLKHLGSQKKEEVLWNVVVWQYPWLLDANYPITCATIVCPDMVRCSHITVYPCQDLLVNSKEK